MKKKESAKTPKHTFDESVENYLIGMVLDSEIATAQANDQDTNDTFATSLDMFDGKRAMKDYDWYSNVSLKEGTSIILTDVSTSVNQYFQTRDFVEVVNEGDTVASIGNCKATKKCINKTLNLRNLYHYQKFVRAKEITNLNSHVYAICQWKKDIAQKEIGRNRGYVQSPPDEDGNVGWDFRDEPIYDDVIKYDYFDYDVLDPRLCWVSPEYTYTVQDKKWFAYLSNSSYEQLKAQEKENGYINLDLVKAMTTVTETETERRTKDKKADKPNKTPRKEIDLYTRLGDMWAIVEERNEEGIPTKIKPGYDVDGNILDDAEYLKETVSVIAVAGGSKVLVRFDHTPYIDATGTPYKPVVRGVCYVHPTRDTGLGDGELLIDLDGASNDAFNLAFDRGKLQTIPTMIGEANAVEDNESIFIEPGHTIAIEGGPKALEMFHGEGNIRDIMEMRAIIDNRSEQVTATYPTTMGNIGNIAASTTATAIAGAEQRTNARGNFKAITFEYTFLSEFYWIILQMTWQFAHPKTLVKLMGEDVYNFDPNGDYTYKPVTSSIESEYNKYRKLQAIQQTMQIIMAIPNPKVPELLNMQLEMLYDLMGPDYMKMKKAMLDTGPMSQQAAMMGSGGVSGMGDVSSVAMSNQNGTPQTGDEQSARMAARRML